MRGNGTNVIRIVPYSAVQFASYEQLKKMLMAEGTSDLDTPRRLAAGAGAGLMSVSATYPLDIVRTRISVQTGQQAANVNACPRMLAAGPIIPKMPGIWPTFVIIFKMKEEFERYIVGWCHLWQVSTAPRRTQLPVLRGSAQVLYP